MLGIQAYATALGFIVFLNHATVLLTKALKHAVNSDVPGSRQEQYRQNERDEVRALVRPRTQIQSQSSSSALVIAAKWKYSHRAGRSLIS